MRSNDIASKLDDTRRRLSELTTEIGELMIGPADNKRLTALRRERDELRTSVDELEAAHAAALRREAEADAVRQAQQREVQFDTFKAIADEWASTGEELAGLVEKAAKARVKLGLLAEQAEAAFPTGMINERVTFRLVDTIVRGSTYPIDINLAFAGEAYRHGMANAELPGAQPTAAVLMYDRPAIEPAAQSIRRRRDYFVRLMRERIDALMPARKDAA